MQQTWHTSAVKTIEDAKRKEVPLGATGSGSSQQPKMMNQLLGTKFKIVLGYPGGSEINLALERGEVAARTSEMAGDGTTTATVLAQSMIHEGLRCLAGGLNPMDLRPNSPMISSDSISRHEARCSALSPSSWTMSGSRNA